MTAFNQKLLIRIIKTSNKNFREVQGGRRPHPKKALKGHLVSAVMLNCGSQLFAYFFEPLLKIRIFAYCIMTLHITITTWFWKTPAAGYRIF